MTALRRLHTEEHGDGSPLLLHAGLGQGSWVWRWVLPALAKWFRTIVFDTRGTGRSPADSRPYGVGDLADDAAAILAGRRAHVLGFSMGGYVALTLALREPQLVRSLVLAGTGAGGPERVPRASEVRAAFAAAFGRPPAEYGRLTTPYTLAPGWPDANPARYEEILAARLERPTPYETIAAHAAACYRFYDERVDVERIDAPTLVVHGGADRIVPVENGRMLAARLPRAEYVELPGWGHNLMLEDPGAFVQVVLEFLSTTEDP